MSSFLWHCDEFRNGLQCLLQLEGSGTYTTYSGACEVCSRWNGAVLLAFSLGLTCHYFLGDTVFSKVSLPWLNLSPVSLAFTSRLYDLSMFKVSWKTSIASLGSLSWCNEVFLLMFQQWIFLKEKRLLLKPRWNCYFFFP